MWSLSWSRSIESSTSRSISRIELVTPIRTSTSSLQFGRGGRTLRRAATSRRQRRRGRYGWRMTVRALDALAPSRSRPVADSPRSRRSAARRARRSVVVSRDLDQAGGPVGCRPRRQQDPQARRGAGPGAPRRRHVGGDDRGVQSNHARETAASCARLGHVVRPGADPDGGAGGPPLPRVGQRAARPPLRCHGPRGGRRRHATTRCSRSWARGPTPSSSRRVGPTRWARSGTWRRRWSGSSRRVISACGSTS